MIAARLDPIGSDFDGWLKEDLAPEGRRKAFAAIVREDIAQIDRENDAAAGRDLPYTVAVDGRQGAALESVDPERGTITAAWSFQTDVVAFIGDLLRAHSPVLTGRYRAEHKLFADGVEVGDAEAAIGAKEIMWIAGVPYARKIEHRTQPDGVYEGVAAVATQRFGNTAEIAFTFREMPGGGYVLKGRQRTSSVKALAAWHGVPQEVIRGWRAAGRNLGSLDLTRMAPVQSRRSSAFRRGQDFLATRQDTQAGGVMMYPAIIITAR